MTEPIDTTKSARDMTPAEREAFIRQCRKLESAPPQQPVDTRSARDMSPDERKAWMAAHRRKFQ
jgi:hypothetical protein